MAVTLNCGRYPRRRSSLEYWHRSPSVTREKGITKVGTNATSSRRPRRRSASRFQVKSSRPNFGIDCSAATLLPVPCVSLIAKNEYNSRPSSSSVPARRRRRRVTHPLQSHGPRHRPDTRLPPTPTSGTCPRVLHPQIAPFAVRAISASRGFGGRRGLT
ncbi:hypothetical protein B0H11DRAFT_2070448 [Mycena galericulata]|nr:hypothetical protein B0H11DRAFT_2070448 [Mycena galericulata]